MAPSEIKLINFDLKAEIPGIYEAPASSAYLYYTNEFKSWSALEIHGIRSGRMGPFWNAKQSWTNVRADRTQPKTESARRSLRPSVEEGHGTIGSGLEAGRVKA